MTSIPELRTNGRRIVHEGSQVFGSGLGSLPGTIVGASLANMKTNGHIKAVVNTCLLTQQDTNISGMTI